MGKSCIRGKHCKRGEELHNAQERARVFTKGERRKKQRKWEGLQEGEGRSCTRDEGITPCLGGELILFLRVTKP